MTIKRRIFISNTVMVLFSLILMLGIGGILVSKFKEEYFRDENNRVQLNENVYTVQTMLSNIDHIEVDWNSLSDNLSQDGYLLDVSCDQQYLFTNLNNSQLELIEDLKDNTDGSRNKVYFWESATIVRRIFDQNGKTYDVIAINYPKDNQLFGMEHEKFEKFIIFYIIVGCASVVLLLLISQMFTKNLVKRIMNPVHKLMDGAKRIENENLQEPIIYQGEIEFEKVCDSFNQMQRHLKAGMEKNEAYERARTDMISGISHDLRTPLTSVKGYIKGVKDGVANTPQKQEQYLDIAYKKACDMDVLLQKLFYFSKLETGNMPFFKVDTDLGQFVSKVVNEIKEDLYHQNNRIQLVYCETQENHQVLIDTEQMKRVLTNLVENSVKYSDIENIEIKFNLFRENNMEILSIQDNGCGVKEEKLPHLFEQFYRGDESRNSKKDGNGLGLFIAKYIVEQHGGTIKAENRNGLKITITLPCKTTTGKEENQ